MTARKTPYVLFLLTFVFLQGCESRYSSHRTKPAKLSNSIGMQLSFIPAGEFTMGDSSDSSSSDSVEATTRNTPAHHVRVSKGFYLGVYEVTQEQYAKIMGVNPSYFASDGDGKELVNGVKTDDFPVDRVTWEEAVEFCRRLSELPEEKQAGLRYRLPTEAEWEYACRGGSKDIYSCGPSLTSKDANISAPVSGLASTGPRPVGSYRANHFGLFDMHGNVWEWCGDSCRVFDGKAQVDPVGSPGLLVALRGGAWDWPASYARCDARTEALAGYVYFGLRVACDSAIVAD